jgi:hypothetical protein
MNVVAAESIVTFHTLECRDSTNLSKLLQKL